MESILCNGCRKETLCERSPYAGPCTLSPSHRATLFPGIGGYDIIYSWRDVFLALRSTEEGSRRSIMESAHAHYPPPVDQLLTYGEGKISRPENWPNYLQLGLGLEQVPDLI